MPIKGMTDSDTPRYVHLGELRKGGEKPVEGKRPGQDLDHFRVTFAPQFEMYSEIFAEMYGDKPTEFRNVYVIGDTPAQAFPNYMMEFNGSNALIRHCDGEHIDTWMNGDGKYMKVKKLCERDMKPVGCQCKETGLLKLVFQDFLEETGLFGYFLATTHSKHDILAIDGVLKGYAAMFGGLAGVRFVFGRNKQKITRPDTKNGGRAPMAKSLFYLHLDPDFAKTDVIPALTAARQQRAALGYGASTLALPDSVSDPAVATAAVAARLGNGGSRRMGEPLQVGQAEPAVVTGVVNGNYQSAGADMWDEIESLNDAQKREQGQQLQSNYIWRVAHVQVVQRHNKTSINLRTMDEGVVFQTTPDFWKKLGWNIDDWILRTNVELDGMVTIETDPRTNIVVNAYETPK